MPDKIPPRPLEPEEINPELLGVLDQLERLTARLGALARLVAVFTACSILMTLSFGAVGVRTSMFARLNILVVGIAFPLAAIVAIVAFDIVKRKGNVLFKELSDELQWYVRFSGEERYPPKEEPTNYARPGLHTRIVLREYASSTTLPLLASAGNGPAIYAASNILLALTMVLLSILTRPPY